MEQVDTLQKSVKQRPERNWWRLLSMMLLTVLLGTAGVNGQGTSFDWSTLSSDDLYRNGLDEGKKLEFYFKAYANVADAEIQITLPKGVKATATSPVVTPESDCDLTFATAVATSSGDNTIITIPVSGGIGLNTIGHAKVDILADCAGTAGSVGITAKVVDKASSPTVTDVGGSTTVTIIDPILNVGYVKPDETTADFENGASHKVTLTSIGGKTNGVTIKLTVDDTYTLSDFTLGGVSLGGVTLTNKVYTIGLTSEEIDAAGKVLEFKSVHPGMGSNRTIKYDITTGCDVKYTGDLAFLVRVDDAGAAAMDVLSIEYVESDRSTPCYTTGEYPTLDGSLVYAKVTFKNSGTGAAAYFKAQSAGYDGGLFYHKKGETVYYRIEDGTIQEVSKVSNSTSWSMTEIPLPTESNQWYRYITAEIYDVIPAGKTIEVYFPTHFGKIYETGGANDNANIIADSRNYHMGIRSYAVSVQNKKGETGAAGGYKTDFKVMPRFYEKAPSLTFTDVTPANTGAVIQEEIEMNINTGILGLTSAYSTKLKITPPSWLEIESVDISQPQYGSTTSLFSIASTGTAGEYAITRSTADASAKMILKCSFKVDQLSSKPSGNAEDVIRYSLIQELTVGGSEVSAYETSRFIQPVYYLSSFEGLMLESFELKRDAVSQGYRPVGNTEEGDIADGTTAPDQDLINHTIYMNGDQGAFEWKIKITDPVGSGEAIFLPLETSNYALGVSSNGLKFDDPTVSVDGGSASSIGMEYKKSDDLKGYVQYSVTGSLAANTELSIRLPFTVNGYKNAFRPITTKALIGGSSDNPITGTGTFKGSATSALSIGTYSLEPIIDLYNGSLNFASATSVVSYYTTFYTFWSNFLTAPQFPYEVRQLAYLSKLVIRVPKGYTLQTLTLHKYDRTAAKSAESSDIKNLLSGVTPDTASDADYDIYTTDVASLFGSSGWPYPDEKWEQRLYYSLKASSRVEGSSSIYFDVEFTNPTTGTNAYKVSSTKVLAYKGNTASVESLSPLTPDDKSEVSMSVNFSNGSSSSINDNWLMVEGSFSDLEAEVGGSSVTVADGKFVPVSSSIASGKSQTVILKFKFTGNSGDAIKLTSLSGWQGSYTPSGTPSDNNMGGSGSVIINPLSNKINASLKVDRVMFSEDEEYKLTATLSSASSPGSIKNPVMDITVPAGQTVKSAVVSYGGTDYNLSAAEFATKYPVAGGKFTFDVRKVITPAVTDVTFPGYASVPNANLTIATLVVTYEAGSGSPTTGMNFSGDASAEGLNDGAITMGGVESQKMFPKLSLTNEFTVTLTSDGNAFSAGSKNRILTAKVTVTKKGGVIPSTDYIELELPKYLSLNGTPSCLEGTTSVTSNDDTGTNRIVQLVLPTSVLTAVGSTATYTIPVVYNGTDAEAPAPKKELVAKYITEALIFGSLQPVAAATGSLDVLFVKSNTLAVFADQTPGGTLSIESTGVTGEFWTGTAWGGSAASTTISPVHGSENDIADAAGLLSTQKVKVTYDSQSYGEVELPYTVYPSLVYTLAYNSFTDCGTVSVDLSTLVNTKTATNTTVTFYSDLGCVSDLSGTPSFTSSTTIYARASNQGGDENPPKSIAITVNNDLDVTISASSTSLSAGGTLTLTASLTGTAPSGAKYQWFKDGGSTPVATTTTATYTMNPVAVSDGGSYHVLIVNSDNTTTGLCRNESPALAITVSPANVVLSPSSATVKDCTLPVTVYMDSKITVSNSGDFVSGDTFWWNNSNTIVGANKLGDNNTIQLSSGTHTVYVWAKSGDNYSTTPAELTLVVSQYVAISLGTVAITPTNGALEVAVGSNATGTITITGTGGDKNVSDEYDFRLYDNATSTTSVDNNTTGSFSLTTLAAPASMDVVGYKEYIYYVTAQGMCTESAKSAAQTFKVYPLPVLDLKSLPLSYCETDGSLLGGIDLWEYIDSPNDNLFTYTYSTDGGSSWSPLAAGTVTIPQSVGIHSYELKAVNKLTGSSNEVTKPVTITVEKKTVINKIQGNEVTEGEAVNIVVSAEGEPTLTYAWEKWDGSSWQLISGVTGNTYNLSTSVSISENGDRYRVTVNGGGSLSGCNLAVREFTLSVKSGQVPPLGNNKVTWDVIGYGNVVVTADGLSISSGSHVNNGTTLHITGTTWKSNVLESITINGTEYSSSSVSYTVSGEDVHIVVEFLGSDPNPDPDSNAEIGNSTRIWSEGGYACIYTETAGRVRIVTFNGRVVTDQKLSEGESRIQLPDGYYIVTLSDGTTAKVAVRNF